MTNKQQQELDFFCKVYKISPTEAETEQYFNWTVMGKDKDAENIRSKNCLFQAKRKWDIQLKMYREDIEWGEKHGQIVFKEELIEDFNHPYATKCLNKLFNETKGV